MVLKIVPYYGQNGQDWSRKPTKYVLLLEQNPKLVQSMFQKSVVKAAYSILFEFECDPLEVCIEIQPFNPGQAEYYSVQFKDQM